MKLPVVINLYCPSFNHRVLINNTKYLLLGLVLLSITKLLASDSSSNSDTSERGKLVFAIDLIRHGDRNPTAQISSAPHEWPEGLGQLTPIGMHQEYALGNKLRHRYVDQEKLLPKSYQPGTLYVRSSGVDRTIMSAESFLVGLYPPGTGPLLNLPFLAKQPALPCRYQPIPIYTMPHDQDRLLIPENTTVGNFEEMLDKEVASTPEWKNKMKELQPHLPAWKKALGVPENQPSHIWDSFLMSNGNLLYIYQLKHVSLPSSLSKSDVAALIDAGNWSLVSIFKSPVIGKATEGALLREIAQHLEEATQHKTTLKYILYAAHDSTVMGLMSAMGVPLDRQPPYASDVNIALYDRGNHDYYIKVMMNDEPVKLPGANGTTCSLHQFMVLAK